VTSGGEERPHHSLRERLDAARAAADEVVAEESGQLGSETSALAVPFEQAAAAVRAAVDPESLAEGEVTDRGARGGDGDEDQQEPPAG